MPRWSSSSTVSPRGPTSIGPWWPAWSSAACAPWPRTSSALAAPTSRWTGRRTRAGPCGVAGPVHGGRRLSDVTLVVQDWGGPIGLGLLDAAPGGSAGSLLPTPSCTRPTRPGGPFGLGLPRQSDGTVTVEQMLLDYQRLTQELTPFSRASSCRGPPSRTCRTPSWRPMTHRSRRDFLCGPRQLPLLMGLTPGSACARLNRRTMKTLATFDRPFLTAFSDSDPATRGWAEVLRAHVPGAAGRST